MQIGNLRFPKVFVFDPSSELVAGNTVKPEALTLNQVGFFNAETGVGTTTTPTNVTAPVISIHQNLGDNAHGTVRTKNIPVQGVIRWRGDKATAAVDQVTYIGYDEVVGTKTLTAYKGQDVELSISVFDNELTKWYGPVGYTERIVLDLARCAPCAADCELLDPDDIADFFVAYINGTAYPAGDFPVSLELTNFVTASKVATGTQGEDDRRVGIKLVAKAKNQDSLNVCDTQQFYKALLTTFNVGIPGNCPNFPVTTTTKAKVGKGYALDIAELEMESQGYDRVRDVAEEVKYMKTNYIVRAQNGVKYDTYYLEFQAFHANTAQPGRTGDPYIVIFAVPTGTGAALQTLVNGWLTPLGFPAVTIAASTGKGNTVPIVNS